MRIVLRWPRLAGVTLFLGVLSMLAAVAPEAHQRWDRPLGTLTGLLAAPLTRATTSLYAHMASMSGGSIAAQQEPSLPAELTSLRTERANLQAENRTLRTQRDQLAGTRSGLATTTPRLIPATVLAHDASGWHASVLADIGRAEVGQLVLGYGGGFKLESSDGQPVLHAMALVGQVEQAGRFACRVRLINDRSARTQVQIRRADESTGQAILLKGVLAEGDGQRVWIRNLPRQNAQLQPGDLVYTAQPPPGAIGPVLIGRIGSMQEMPENRLLLSAEVLPFTALDRLSELVIIAP